MLGLLCTRTPKPWILSSLSSSSPFHHHYGLSSSFATNSHVFHRFLGNPFANLDDRRRHRRSFRSGSTAASGVVGVRAEDAAVSVWHAIFPATSGGGDWRRDCLLSASGVVHQPHQRGEGSWNVAWDARPVRWTHRLDLAWVLFGVCAFLAPVDWNNFLQSHVAVPKPEPEPVAVVVNDHKEVIS